MTRNVFSNSLISAAAGICVALTALAAAAQGPLEITSNPTQVTIDLDGRPVARYQVAKNPNKTYLRELYTPQGVQIFRDSPHDHLHHHSLMFAVAVDGVDFWSEGPTCGVQKSRSAPNPHTHSRDGFWAAHFEHQIDWTAADGQVSLVESRDIRVCRLPNVKATLVGWQCRLAAPEGKEKVTLTGATYFGLGARFVQSMDTGGKFLNADGKSGVEGTNDVRSRWTAYSAAVDGKPVTIAMFDSPANPRHPATWFTMDSAFAYLAATLDLSKQPLEIQAGEPLTLNYAVAVWDGHVGAEEIEKVAGVLRELAEKARK